MPPVPPPSKPSGFGPATKSWPTASSRGDLSSLVRFIPFAIFLLVIGMSRLGGTHRRQVDGWVRVENTGGGTFVDVLVPASGSASSSHLRFRRFSTGVAERLESACEARGVAVDSFGQRAMMSQQMEQMNRQMDEQMRRMGVPGGGMPPAFGAEKRLYCRVFYTGTTSRYIQSFQEMSPPNSGFGGMGGMMPGMPGSPGGVPGPPGGMPPGPGGVPTPPGGMPPWH